LNLFSRSDDGFVAIRSGKLYIAPRKTGSMVPVDVALCELLIEMKWLREKPVQVLKVIPVTRR